MSGQDWLEKDFYKTLGVGKDADAAAIKKAYRKLARKWHPDQNPGDAKAEERFKEIGEAYAVLSDPEQRKQYDALRSMAGGGARFQADSTQGGGGAGFEDMFSNLFGGGGGQSGPYGSGAFGQGAPGAGFGGPRPQRGNDLRASTTLTFRQSMEDTTVRMTVDGHSMTVRIPAGVKDGQKIRLRGKGRPGSNGGKNGDLIVTINVARHPVYSRDGDNLRMQLPVTMSEAALGAKVSVPLPDGSHVAMKIPAGTQSGAVLRLRHRGAPNGKRRGDLLVEVQVAVPTKLTKQQREALEAFSASLGDWDPRADLAKRAEA